MNQEMFSATAEATAELRHPIYVIMWMCLAKASLGTFHMKTVNVQLLTNAIIQAFVGNVFSGSFRGVQVRIKEIVLHVIYIHGINVHRLNLVFGPHNYEYTQVL